MERACILIFSCLVWCVHCAVTLEVDRPWLRVPVGLPAVLECCFRGDVETLTPTWHRRLQSNGTSDRQDISELGNFRRKSRDTSCYVLSLVSVQLNDSGLYQCLLSGMNVFTPGTYLQVYEPLQKTINMSETAKNGILITEGILLLLCVLVPSAALVYKSKQLHEIEVKKEMRQQENIYQGLNLEDCSPAYDQIQSSRAESQYQDVCNVVAQEEVQFEKP